MNYFLLIITLPYYFLFINANRTRVFFGPNLNGVLNNIIALFFNNQLARYSLLFFKNFPGKVLMNCFEREEALCRIFAAMNVKALPYNRPFSAAIC